MAYRLIVLTDLDTVITTTGHYLNPLLNKGDSYKTCQRYEIVDLDRIDRKTKKPEIVITHCNLPAALKKQASPRIMDSDTIGE